MKIGIAGMGAAGLPVAQALDQEASPDALWQVFRLEMLSGP